MAQRGRPKGSQNRKWIPEEKERIVKRYFEGTISRTALAREEDISDGMLHRWIKKYQAEGLNGLVSKTGKTGHSGNPYAALHKSKDLPDIKRLQLQVAQLQVEVERLKKGYAVKGVGANKEYAFLKDLNIKS